MIKIENINTNNRIDKEEMDYNFNSYLERNSFKNNVKAIINTEVDSYLKSNPEFLKAIINYNLEEDINMEAYLLYYKFIKRICDTNYNVSNLPLDIYNLQKVYIPKMVIEFMENNFTIL